MERLVEVLHDLNTVVDLLELKPLTLPPIAVIGAKGHGKSAVLEALFGQQFLPRPTRVPIICHLSLDLDAKEDYVEFLHAPDKKLFDFNLISREIESESRRLCGDRMYAASPIHLKFFSRHVLPLTVADLPGLLEPGHADEKLVRDISTTFVRVSTCLVLHVTNASSDLRNSLAMNIAAKVDPGGSRSIPVFTHMEEITERVPILESLIQRGAIGVSLQGLEKFQPGNHLVLETLAHEPSVFNHHPAIGNAAQRMGIGQVSVALAQLILHHIRNAVPALKMKVNGALIRCQEEYESLRDDPMLNAEESKGALLLNLLTRYADEYRDSIDCESADNFTKELFGGARISYIFVDVFAPRLESINPAQSLTRDGIRTMVRNAKGAQPSAFIPLVCFEILVQQLLEHLLQPVLWCVDLVYTELCTIARQAMNKTLIRYPLLSEQGLETMVDLIDRSLEPSKAVITDMLKMEFSYVNTNHHDFVHVMFNISEEMRAQEEADRAKAAKAEEPSALGDAWQTVKSYPKQAVDKMKEMTASNDVSHSHQGVPPHIKVPEEVDQDELMQVQVVEVALERYYEVIRGKLADTIPKAIMYTLVNRTKKMVLNQLVSSLYQPDKFNDLLVEADDVVEKRRECQDRRKVLQRAVEVLRNVSDFVITM